MDEGLTIAEVADRTGLTAHTLRYYERAGLLRPPGRGGNGHRRYREDDLERIRILTCLRATGMSIADVRRYFELVQEGPSTAAARRRLLLEHRARVQAQIEQLQSDLVLVDYKISMYARIETSCAAGTVATGPEHRGDDGLITTDPQERSPATRDLEQGYV